MSIIDWATIDHFTHTETMCKCGCGRNDMDFAFMQLLDKAREVYGAPIKINSGFRCIPRNRSEGGRFDSAHLRGLAVDIRVLNNKHRFDLVFLFYLHGITRFGMGKTFLHIDADPIKKERRIWLYS